MPSWGQAVSSMKSVSSCSAASVGTVVEVERRGRSDHGTGSSTLP